MTLVEFLEARITEDEAGAERWFESWRANGGVIDVGPGRYGPARVLAECESKRRIIVALADTGWRGRHELLKMLALPYADHEDYLPEWKP